MGMTGDTDDFDSVPGADIGAVERHFGDIAPEYSAAGSANAMHARARGAADRMWQKVEEDLARIDRVEADEAHDG